MGLLL